MSVSAQTKPRDIHAFEPFVVTGKRPMAADAEGPDGIRTYDESEIEASAAFTLQEFFDTLPRGTGEEQLILVDGVPMELSAITPAMVASVEVSYSGAMPQYGAYSRGRIINVRLKQEYDTLDLGLQAGGSLHGDGWRREANFSAGSGRGKWRVTYSGEYNRTDSVRADARDFSREQDHRAQGGRDFRLPWGDPATVQAVSGNLNGVVDVSGNPVPVALVPENVTGALVPAQFLAGTGPSASGQRFFNTSPYLYLQAPSENLSARFRVIRNLKKGLVSLSATHRQGNNRREGPPPVTAASAATLVPAAFNPFGQDVLVGLVHTGFGPVAQETESSGSGLSLLATWAGGTGENTWRVIGNLSHNWSGSENDTRDLAPAAFTAALASATPATRFNPFVGAGSAANAALYPALAIHRLQENANHTTSFRGSGYSPVFKGWGAGPVQLSLTGNATWRRDERAFRNVRGVADGITRNYDSNYGLTTDLNAPLLKERPRAHRLHTGFSASYLANNRGGDTWRGRTDVAWAPVRTLVFNVGYGRSTTSPGESGSEDPDSAIETLLDPRRTPAVAENVQVIFRRSVSTETSRGDDLRLTTSFDVPFRPGLRLNAGYEQARNNRATGRPFRSQDVIDNEIFFAGRVVRETPTAADIALGQPGRILVVDTTASAVAKDLRRTLRAGVEFQWPAPVVNPARGGPGGGRGPGGGAVAVGQGVAGRGAGPGQLSGQGRARPVNRFTLNLDAVFPLEARYEVAEGQGFVSRESGPANQPDWTAQAYLRWNYRRWIVGMNVRHAALSRQGTIPAITTVGADVSYRFENDFWGKFGKNLLLRLRVQNLGGDEPPYADTILGYRGGSPLGTTISMSVNSPW